MLNVFELFYIKAKNLCHLTIILELFFFHFVHNQHNFTNDYTVAFMTTLFLFLHGVIYFPRYKLSDRSDQWHIAFLLKDT